MSDEKRMAGGYEIVQAIRFGETEVVLGVDMENMELPYMVANARTESNELFHRELYDEIIGCDDYLVIAGIYLEKAKSALDKHMENRISSQALTSEHCTSEWPGKDLEGEIIIIKASSIRLDLRDAHTQLCLATGGFGCKPGASGTKVYCTELFSGEKMIWRSGDVPGIANREKLPNWAKSKIREIEAGKHPKSKPEKSKGGDAR